MSTQDPTQQAPAGLEDPDRHQAFLMYCSGWTAEEISQKTGLRADLIRQWVCRGKWAEQKKAMEGFRTEKHPLEEQLIVKAVKNSRKSELKEKFVENMGEMAAEDSAHWKQLSPEERLVAAPGIVPLAGMHRKSLELDKDADSKERGHISLTFLTNTDNLVRVLPAAKVREIEDEKSPEK